MEKETKESSGLGRAFMAIGLLIILAGLVFTNWWIAGFGAVLLAVGLLLGGTVQT